jgi:hypothetical protein
MAIDRLTRQTPAIGASRIGTFNPNRSQKVRERSCGRVVFESIVMICRGIAVGVKRLERHLHHVDARSIHFSTAGGRYDANVSRSAAGDSDTEIIV